MARKNNETLTLKNEKETVTLEIERRTKKGKGGYDFNSVTLTVVGVGVIYSCSLVPYTDKKSKQETYFLSLPSRKGSDDKYYSYIRLEQWIKEEIELIIEENIVEIDEYLA